MARKRAISWSDIANTKVGLANSGKAADLWASKKTKKSKYNNIKVEIDGINFDSMGEGERYTRLKRFARIGKIRDLRLQVAYELVPKGRHDNGKAIQAMTYVADFVYFDIKKDCQVVEDFKGRLTQEYKLKRKLMMHVHGIKIYETSATHNKEGKL